MTLYFKAGRNELKNLSYHLSRSALFVRLSCNGKTIYSSRIPLLVFGRHKRVHKPIELEVGEKEVNKIKIEAESTSKTLGSSVRKVAVTAFVDGKLVAKKVG